MAQPYLSFRELQKGVDRTGEFYSQGIQSIANSASNLINKYNKAVEDNINGVYSPLNDINGIKNDLIKLYGVNQWSKLKDKYVPEFKKWRGAFNPETKIQFQSDLMDLQRGIEYLDSINKSMDAAKSKAQTSPYYKFNQSAMDDFVKSMSPNESGEYDWKNISEIGTKSMRSETGVPFLEYAEINSDPIFREVYDKSVKELEQKGDQVTEVKDANGKTITTTSIPYTRNPDSVKSSMRMKLSKLPMDGLLALENSLMKNATPEQIKMADENYSQYETPFLEMAIDNYPVEESRKQVLSKTTEKGEKELSGTKKELNTLLNKQGKSRENIFGLSSGDFVDYGQASSKYRNLYNFVPPEDASVRTVIKREGGKIEYKKRPVNFIGTTPSDYEIVGHDKENGQFWIVPSKQKTIEEMGENIPVETMIAVPEDYILDHYDAKTEYKKPEQKKESTSFIGVPKGGF